MTKICMVVHKNYYRDTRVRRYAESLIEAGASVDVICLVEDYESVSEVNERIRVFSIPLQHLTGSRISYAVEYLWAFLLYFIKLSVLYFRNHYSIIHVHNMPDFLIFAALIPKVMGARLILDIHDPMPEVYISKYGDRPNSLLLRLMYLQEKISCFIADHVVTANSNFRKNLIRRGIPAEKITVIHNYPNPLLFDRDKYSTVRQNLDDRFVLIYPGTIAPRYGLETAIRALSKIKLKIPEICLVIMGPENIYKDELERLVVELGVSSYVQFRQVVPNEEVPRQIVMADVGIYPAIKDAHMNIATPTKVMEFAFMGLPIITSRLSVLEEMFDDSAVMFFEPGNADQFADCVIALYKNPDLTRKLISNTDTSFVKKHSWEGEFPKYLSVLRQLLTDGNSN